MRPFARVVLVVLLACAFLAGCRSAPAPPPAVTPGPAVVPPPAPPKIGVALGAGGARGFAQVGVLRVLEQEHIPIHCVAGASVGSLIGALYADKASVLDLEFEAIEITREHIFDRSLLSVFSGGFVKGERLEEYLTRRLLHPQIEDMPIRFAAVATDLRSGGTVAFEKGPAAVAVHASCAIPGVFVPVTIGDRVYVDGGVTDPVPADVARRMGADVVIAVPIPAGVPPEPPTTPLAVAYHSVNVMAAEIARLRASEADVVITPDVGNVAYDDFDQKKRLIRSGEAAARAALPQIRAAIAAARTSGS
ncbi:MAG: patatin-like phospholipase family protein [Acidobacteria bacterium]|nr:patatin-like phospholipase family protein [Acidobacteriota bacterium]